jgi:transposase
MKYSLDFKNLAVKLYTSIASVRKTASYVQVPKSTLHNWLRSNKIIRDRHQYRKVTASVSSMIEDLLESNPFSTAADVVHAIKKHMQTHLSKSCVRCWISKLGFTRKKPSFVVQRTNLDEERKSFALHHCDLDPASYLSIDETSLYFDMKPSLGYSKRGRRLVRSQHTHHRHRLSLILAIGCEGVVAHKLVHGSVKTEQFQDFIQSVNRPGKTLLLDNASFHKTRSVRNAISSCGMTCAYLPPYTPQFQPVEHCFATLKSMYRRTSPACDRFDPTDIATRLLQCLDKLRSHSLGNLFTACWERMKAMKTV